MDRGDADSLGVEIWRGGVNTWECDEMGHMNVRFYVTRAMEGLVGLAAALGMPKAFTPDAGASLLLREQHIRFLREARPGGLLHMRGAVIEMGETDAQVLQVLYHSAHRRAGGELGQPRQPCHRARRAALCLAAPGARAAGRLTVPVPFLRRAAQRLVDLGPFESRASLDRATALGLTPIALGAVAARDCDPFGRARAEQLHLPASPTAFHSWKIGEVHCAIIAEGKLRPAAAETCRRGGAGISAGLSPDFGQAAGARVAVHSWASPPSEPRTQRVVHWMLDPDTRKSVGKPGSIAVAATLDLDTRKIVAASPAALAGDSSGQVIGAS